MTLPYREPPLPPPPPRPPLLVPLLVGLLCAWLTAYTSHKLATMARLRGELLGIPSRHLTIDGEIRRYNPQDAVYRLVDTEHPDVGPWRIELSASQMVDVRYGDTLSVRCLEDERECFVPGSIYVNDGNVSFDRGLLAIELSGLLACVWTLARRLYAWRRALRSVAWRRPDGRGLIA